MHCKDLHVLLLLAIFLSCEEVTEFNPWDPTSPEFEIPQTNIIVGADTVTTSSTMFTFSGNKDSMLFSYMLEHLSSFDSTFWSDWNADTIVLFESISEGSYQFFVKGKYLSGTEDDTPAEHEFIVNYIRPTTNITSGPEGESTIDKDSVTFTWELEPETECSYYLDDNNWSDWSILSSSKFNYLDEGYHSFHIKSRYEPLVEEKTPVIINFTVDALDGPGLRVHPLMSTIDMTTVSFIDIFVEEVDSLALGEFNVIYDQSLINIASIDKGAMLSYYDSPGGATPLLIAEDDNGVININFTILGGPGLSGSGSIVRFKLIGQSTGSSTMQIINPVLRDVNNNAIPFLNPVNGQVVVE